MSVRFASTNHPLRRLGWRAARRGLLAPALARAANDNPADVPGAALAPQAGAAPFEPMLIAALRHFAVHGLAAAEAALAEAHEAGLAGDAEARAHWLAITALFDRRRAVAAGAPTPAA
ncbi:MAG: hypothetical protein ACK4E5_02665 [Erythrobacter cryptus]|jgi:hypothetical protein